MKNIQFERNKNEILNDNKEVNKEINSNDDNVIKETKYKKFLSFHFLIACYIPSALRFCFQNTFSMFNPLTVNSMEGQLRFQLPLSHYLF